MKFANARVSSECYQGKRRAFGLTPVMRGGRGRRNTYKPGDLVIPDSDESEALAYEVAHELVEHISMDSSDEG